jgi:hypothetical protein
MEFDLKELAATLTIGAFFVFGFEFIILNFFGKSISGKIFNNLGDESRKYVMGAVIVTFCFIFGMGLEDVSNKFVDDDSWLSILPFINSDDEIKYQVFFYKNEPKDFEKSPFITKALFKNLISAPYQEESSNLENYFWSVKKAKESNAALPETPDKEKVKNVIKRFYYDAKNEVYKTINYYDELKKIQMRIDFSRSMLAVVSFLISVISVTMMFKIPLICIVGKYKRELMPYLLKIKQIRNRKGRTRLLNVLRLKNKKFYRLNNIRKKWFAKPYLRWKRVLITYAILLSIYGLSAFAYASEEAEYDKRVYGYYLSIKVNSTQPPP